MYVVAHQQAQANKTTLTGGVSQPRQGNRVQSIDLFCRTAAGSLGTLSAAVYSCPSSTHHNVDKELSLRSVRAARHLVDKRNIMLMMTMVQSAVIFRYYYACACLCYFWILKLYKYVTNTNRYSVIQCSPILGLAVAPHRLSYSQIKQIGDGTLDNNGERLWISIMARHGSLLPMRYDDDDGDAFQHNFCPIIQFRSSSLTCLNLIQIGVRLLSIAHTGSEHSIVSYSAFLQFKHRVFACFNVCVPLHFS